MSRTGIALLLLSRCYLLRWPGVLVVASLLTAVGYLLRFDDTGGRIVGEIPPGLPNFAMSPLHLGAWGVLLPAAFALALIRQGLAKISAAVSQTMPVSVRVVKPLKAAGDQAQTGTPAVVAN